MTCLLVFEGIKRTVFSAGSYSELFLLDEATAVSAGHRPCNDCQKDRFKEFKTAWLSANTREKGVLPLAKECLGCKEKFERLVPYHAEEYGSTLEDYWVS